MKSLIIIGLSIGLVAALLLAISIEIKDAFPLDKSSVQFNVQEVNGQIVERAEVSYVAIKPFIFYTGIILLLLSYILQIVGLVYNK